MVLKKSNQGISLVELLVVIGIIGILLAVGIPALRNYQRRYYLKDAADKTILALRRTQSLALSPQKIEEEKILGYWVKGGASPEKLTVYPVTTNGEKSKVFDYKLPDGVQVESVSVSNPTCNSSSASTSIFPIFFSTPIEQPEVPYKRNILFTASFLSLSGSVSGSCPLESRYIRLKYLGQCYLIEINCSTGKIELK